MICVHSYDVCKWSCFCLCNCPCDGCCYLLLSHKHTWRAYLTPVDCFCNVCDWPTSPENVSRGDSMLEYNHTSLTWHIMKLPATAPPLSTAGHKLLSNGPQECRRLRHEEKLDKTWQTWRTRGVTRCSSSAQKYTSFSVWPCHTRCCRSAFPSSFSFLVPSCLREESPSQNMCKRIKLGCTLVVALTDQRQDPCFNLSRYTVPCVFQHFSCLQCWLLWQWSTRETSGVNLIKLSGSASLVWWL